MGTTAVAMLFCPDQTAWVAHVGDSRAYRFRNARLEPITRDHSVVAELERQGHLTPEEAAVHPRRNEILRSVGVSATVEVEVAQVDLQVGDQYLLCSDGLSGLVSDPEIARVVEANGIEDAARLLIRMANDAGGPDNITVQIARFGLPEDVPEPVPAAATGAYAVSDPAPPRRDLRRRQMAVVVAAVLVAGIAALTVLWRVYSVSADRRSAAETPAPEESPRPAVPER
jgi:hypothetical protein